MKLFKISDRPTHLLSIILYVNMLGALLSIGWALGSILGEMIILPSEHFVPQIMSYIIVLFVVMAINTTYFIISRWIYLIYQNIEKGDTFHYLTGKRLVVSSYLLLGNGLLAILAESVILPIVNKNEATFVYEPRVDVFFLLVLSLFLYTLGRVFQHGAELKKDQDLTI